MHLDRWTPDHIIVMRAAGAYRDDQPDFAKTLIETAEAPMVAALELIGVFMQERAEQLSGQHR